MLQSQAGRDFFPSDKYNSLTNIFVTLIFFIHERVSVFGMTLKIH